MKRASSESTSSATPAKKPSTFSNTGGFTADSIPQHHYHLGEDNYAVLHVIKVNFSRQFLPSVCLLTETEWNQLQFIRKKISDSCKSLMFGNFLKKKILLEVSSRSPRTNLQMELSDVEIVLSTSLTEILADNIKSRIDDVLVCNACLENQANQLGHECVTMNSESILSLYGDSAILSIDIELLVKEFVEKNMQMLNYINETFLNNLNIVLLAKNACDMYIASDIMPHRMF
ncbi:hypothetical protein AVEN_244808-1 [Araneus ventricosus]|uniref:Uncharacterized protein n=1 Tax=Araneus ventricosus TaxID=182803 RepID=A0A4Y2QJX3_ARAVE|nr:hypothetical protein AVEN_244808-1 [Araneus ventricosus]